MKRRRGGLEKAGGTTQLAPPRSDKVDLMSNVTSIRSAVTEAQSRALTEAETALEPEPGQRDSSSYELGVLLGEGGMGRVYKARDLVLDRFVALKFLRSDVPVMEKRFLAEARAQARVIHPHVCRVYGLGRLPQGRFIAMQYVEGNTLLALARELSINERVSIVRAVAEAVQAAHDTGLLHRDLKPANVLIERRGNLLHPFVTDFGLARDLIIPGSTVGGTILGSPLYMAPEQATGDLTALSVRTDVYGLGGILYELLVGRPPFLSATSLQALYRTLHEEPVPPRKLDPLIPLPLQRIALQCLEKNPRRRYATAREVGEDLRRFLLGEPVKARRTNFALQSARAIARHRFPAALVGVALLMAGILTTNRLSVAHRERRVAALSQRFGEQLREIESTLRTSALLPAHDVRPERKAAQLQLESIRREMAEAGHLAEVPGLLALGHGYLALREFGAAQEAFEAALQRAELSPQDHYALGLAMGARYAEELDLAERMGGEGRGHARAQELEQTRTSALAHLRAAGSPQTMEGRIALFERRYDDALSKARLTFAQSPFSYEAKKLGGDVLVARAVEALRKGRRQQATLDLDEAGSAFAVAGKIGRSDPGISGAECGRQRELVGAALWNVVDLRPAATAAVTACRAALLIDPDSVTALNALSRIELNFSDWLLRTGIDAREAIHEALASAGAANRIDPRNLEALRNLGAAWQEDGLLEEARGGDSRPSLLRNIETAKKLIALEPNYSRGYNSTGLALVFIASYESARGLDPSRRLEEASAALGQARRLNAEQWQPLATLGWVERTRASWQIEHGADAADALTAVRRWTRQAGIVDAAATPHAAWSACDAAFLEAIQRTRDDGDAAMAFGSAVRECRNQESLGIKLDVQRIETWSRTLESAALVDRGLDPRTAVAEARSLLAASSELVVVKENLYLRSRLDEVSARDDLARGRDPRRHLLDAERLSRLILAQFPGWPLGPAALARVARVQAALHRRQPALAARDAQSGLEAINSALTLRKDWPEMLALKAGFEEVLARTASGDRRSELLRSAALDLAAARAVNPRFNRTFFD